MLPARVTRIHQAFKEIKHMQCDTREGDYRPAARNPLKDILEYRMSNAVDAHLEQKRAEGFPDRRNGSYSRHLLTELGDLLLRIPPELGRVITSYKKVPGNQGPDRKKRAGDGIWEYESSMEIDREGTFRRRRGPDL